MPPKRRAAAAAADATSNRQVKRPRAPKPQLRPQAGLRPTLRAPAPAVPSDRSVIYISSTSPDASEKPLKYADADNTPSGGIFPSDSLQNFVVNSIEIRPSARGALTGHAHYAHLLTLHAQHHKTITSTFDSYRLSPPSNIPPGDPLILPPPQEINLGPRLPEINYARHPPHRSPYTSPIYTSRTYNPLLALAIIHLSKKNLPFLDFTSDTEHLPNVGPHTLPPRFPPPTPAGAMPFLDAATDWPILPGDQGISIVFLPSYYVDGRHCLGFYTRKPVSGRLCAIVFTPCSMEEVIALGLLGVADPRHEIGDFEGMTVGSGGQVGWEVFEVGAGRGRWVQSRGEDRDIWNAVEQVAGVEWVIRVRVTERRIVEWGHEAARRDGGLWGDMSVD